MTAITEGKRHEGRGGNGWGGERSRQEEGRASEERGAVPPVTPACHLDTCYFNDKESGDYHFKLPFSFTKGHGDLHTCEGPSF